MWSFDRYQNDIEMEFFLISNNDIPEIQEISSHSISDQLENLKQNNHFETIDKFFSSLFQSSNIEIFDATNSKFDINMNHFHNYILFDASEPPELSNCHYIISKF